MKEYDIPDWYIKSCEKIKYMFPKAHAAAYVTNAFRIAWFKVHIPLAYYAAYYTIRAKAFDASVMINGKEKVKNKMKEIDMMGNNATPKDKDMYDDLEIVLEMYETPPQITDSVSDRLFHRAGNQRSSRRSAPAGSEQPSGYRFPRFHIWNSRSATSPAFSRPGSGSYHGLPLNL